MMEVLCNIEGVQVCYLIQDEESLVQNFIDKHGVYLFWL